MQQGYILYNIYGNTIQSTLHAILVHIDQTKDVDR